MEATDKTLDSATMTPAKFKEFHEEKLAELPRDLVLRGVSALHEYSFEFFTESIKLYEENPDDWMVPYHFHTGMHIRNTLRKQVKDSELPSGNWDDYYVAVLEIAMGVREF